MVLRCSISCVLSAIVAAVVATVRRGRLLPPSPIVSIFISIIFLSFSLTSVCQIPLTLLAASSTPTDFVMDIKDVSESSEMAAQFRAIIDDAERSNRRKGEIPRDHPLSSLLVGQFNAAISSRGLPDGMEKMITTQVPPPYPPCNRPARALTPLPISKMKLQEHHRGHLVIVRTLTVTNRLSAITVIVEDEEGTAVLLQLYNQPEESLVKADDVLPQGSVCLIKEPFFKDTPSGSYSLRVDHVGDIVILSSNDERIPEVWRAPRSIGGDSPQIRLQGNAAVAEQDWGTAERL